MTRARRSDGPVIDIHCHRECAPAADYMKEAALAAGKVALGHGNPTTQAVNKRQLAHIKPKMDLLDVRLADMDAMGVDVQAVAIAVYQYYYWADADGRCTSQHQEEAMGKAIATITTSLDGYVAGPNDGPACGLGEGGERLHYWVMGGPWTYETEHNPSGMSEVDKEFLDGLTANVGGGVIGRGMYDAAGAWGGTNPFGGTMVVLTHRTDDQPPPESGFRFVEGFDAAFAAAREIASDQDVTIGGGADIIRQALAAGVVDEVAISTAPVVLGGGKRLFEGFDHDIDLEIRSVHQSPWATHVRYAVTGQ